MTIATPDAVYAIGLPPEKAIAHLSAKQAQVTGPWHEWLDGQHARGFTAANVAKLDVLQDIQDSLTKALKGGQTLQQWKAGLVPELQRKGWWGNAGTTAELNAAGRVDADGVIAKGLTPTRLKTIFQTNMQSAYMAGRYADMIEEAEERPFWQYVAILDAKTRPAHRAMNGKIFRYDDPGWKSFFPPCGYRCRCRVRNFSQADVTRRKLQVDRTEGKLQEVQVPLRSGGSTPVTRYTDKGLPGGKFQPDPGFSNNPGLNAWQPTLAGNDVQLSKRYVETAVQGPAFEQFVKAKAPQGSFPVAIAQPARQGQFDMPGAVVSLPADLLGQLPRRLGVADFRKIPDILEAGVIDLAAKGRPLVLRETEFTYTLEIEQAAGGAQVIGFNREATGKQ